MLPAGAGKNSKYFEGEPESGGFTCQDETLSQVRDEAIAGKGQIGLKAKKAKTDRQIQRRGVTMQEEISSKIGLIRSSISGQAVPLHNPYVVSCHICKKNFPTRNKGIDEFLCDHKTEKHLRKDQRW